MRAQALSLSALAAALLAATLPPAHAAGTRATASAPATAPGAAPADRAAPDAQAAPRGAACTSINVHTSRLHYADALPALPLFDGRLNGQPAVLAFDTGAFATTLTAEAAARLGLQVSDTAIPASGAGGGTILRSARVDDASIGPARARGRTFPVLPRGAQPPSFDALAGADVIFQNDVELDFAASEARFFASTGCGAQSLAYWGAADHLPYHIASDTDRRPRIAVRIDGIAFEALFDTGSVHTVLSGSAARQLGLHADSAGTQPAAPVSGIGGQASAAWFAHLDDLAIGTEHLPHWPVRLLAAPASESVPADVVLGMDYLRTHRILFAVSQKEVYIAPQPPMKNATR